MGSPMDPNTEMGPLISTQHREKVLSYFRLAREEGATVVTGGGYPSLRQLARQRILRAADNLYWPGRNRRAV